MEWMGAVVVALLGGCVGLLVGVFLQGAKKSQLAEQASAQWATARALAEQAAQQRAAALELLAKHHAELRSHLMMMTSAMAERMQLVGSALAAELREANAEHRNDLRLAVGLPRASVPGEEPPPTRPTPPPPRPAPPPKLDASPRTAPLRPGPLPKPSLPPKATVSVKPSTSASSRSPIEIPAVPPTPRSARRASTGDDPTPPSGWTLEQVRAHTATAEERRS